MSRISLSELPLHDAVLKELKVDWPAKTCTAEVSAFVDGPKNAAQRRRIIWTKVEEVVIPQRAPWGPSTHINSAKEEEGWFVIEMQSGDVIRIAAESVEFL